MNNFGKLLIVTMCLHRAQNNMEHVTEQLTYADGQMHTLLIPLNQIYVLATKKSINVTTFALLYSRLIKKATIALFKLSVQPYNFLFNNWKFLFQTHQCELP